MSSVFNRAHFIYIVSYENLMSWTREFIVCRFVTTIVTER